MSSIAAILTTSNALLNEHTSPRHTSLVAALNAANEALELASTQNRPDLAARAELLRGHCLRELGHWELASSCYERATVCASSAVVVVEGVVVKK